jgi:hypothetical protein
VVRFCGCWFLCVWICRGRCGEQPSNVHDFVISLLVKKGRVFYSEPAFPCKKFFGMMFCREGFTFKNITLEQHGEFKTEPQVLISILPPRVEEQSSTNCDPAPEDPKDPKDKPTAPEDPKDKPPAEEFTFTKEYTNQRTFTVTDQSTLTTGFTLQVTGIPLITGSSPTATPTLTMQKADMHSTTFTSEDIIHDSRTYKKSVSIRPLASEKVIFSQQARTTATPFTVTVVVDADIAASNHDKWTKLSEIPEFTKADKRLFEIKGRIMDTATNNESANVPTKFATQEQCNAVAAMIGRSHP